MNSIIFISTHRKWPEMVVSEICCLEAQYDSSVKNKNMSYSQHTVYLGKLEFALRLTQLSPTRSLWNKQSSSKEESWPARKSRLKTRQKILHLKIPVLPIRKQHKKIQLLVPVPVNTCLLPNADIVQVRLDFVYLFFWEANVNKTIWCFVYLPHPEYSL